VTTLVQGLDLSVNGFIYFRIETTNPGPNSGLTGTTAAFLQPAADAVQLVGTTPVSWLQTTLCVVR
jgi:hypothetical protein